MVFTGLKHVALMRADLSEVCGLGRGTRTLYLERDVAVVECCEQPSGEKKEKH